MGRPDVIIPVYKADKKLERLLSMLLQQTIRPAKIILMNTEAEGFTVGDLKARVERIAVKNDRPGLAPVEVKLVCVDKKDYDHGGTRNLAVKEYSDAPFFLCMTQDAVPADIFLIEKLLQCFGDDAVGAAYARQMAAQNATFTEQYLRLHNYPAESAVKTKADKERLGIKTYMISNACAMYRRSRYEELGGFVTDTIFNEDMIYGASLIEAGNAICYCAEARVYHTHKYGLKEQFKRNFDLAVSQADYPEVFGNVSSEKEGLRYVKGAAEYCMSQRRYGDLFVFFADAVARYIGFFLGKRYKCLPEKVVFGCTLQPDYWKKRKQSKAENKNTIEKDSTKKKVKESFAEVCDETELEERRLLKLAELRSFIKLCNSYSLRYFAVGNTLLGAVCHKGFMPYMDEVILAMPRRDYDRLTEEVGETVRNDSLIEVHLIDEAKDGERTGKNGDGKEFLSPEYFGEDFDEYTLWEFEGMLLRGPALWNEYLNDRFGEYRKN